MGTCEVLRAILEENLSLTQKNKSSCVGSGAEESGRENWCEDREAKKDCQRTCAFCVATPTPLKTGLCFVTTHDDTFLTALCWGIFIARLSVFQRR